ncbi:MAG TPA: diacylglycerol kinase family protein [Dictyobacter sp.]|jgi:YegS/Rv2252/BmrU family lipid kinase|nr:diacylglycerol kinase family protein [Dictyobacter sp.]
MKKGIIDHEHHAQEQKTSAIIIANPTAGSYIQNKKQIDETLSYLRAHNWIVELKLTEGQHDGQRIARAAVQQKLDVVIAVGGDGTVNEVVQELAESDTALGVIPSGTVNVWAREIGIPLDLVGAREILTSGQKRRIDLGQVNDRYFLLMASIGLDAEITHAVEKHTIKRLGVLGYAFLGTALGIGFPNFISFLQIGQQTIRARALQVILGNTQLYGGAVKFAWKARCDDGQLDLIIVRNQKLFGRISVLIDFLMHRKERAHWVQYERVKEVKIHTNAPVAIQADGDPIGYTNKSGFPPTIFRVVPSALTVVVPQKLPESLFSQP